MLPPELNSHILIGLNSIIRHLSLQSRRTCPLSLDMQIRSSDNATHPSFHLAVIVATWPSIPLILTHHLCILLHTSSMLHPNLPPTRLVILPRNSEKRLCSALGVPHVGFIGISHSAPNTSALFDFCSANLPEVTVDERMTTYAKPYGTQS